mgnify:CR=1 FL=1
MPFTFTTQETRRNLYDQFKLNQLARNRKKLILFSSILILLYFLQTIFNFIFQSYYTPLQLASLDGGICIFLLVFMILGIKRWIKRWRLAIDTAACVLLIVSATFFFAINMERGESISIQEHLDFAQNEYIRFSSLMMALFLLIEGWWIRSLLCTVLQTLCVSTVIYWGPKDFVKVADPILFTVLGSLGVTFYSYLSHQNEVATFQEIGKLLGKDAVWKMIVDRLPTSVAVINRNSDFLFSNVCFKELFQRDDDDARKPFEDRQPEMPANCKALFSRIIVKNIRVNGESFNPSKYQDTLAPLCSSEQKTSLFEKPHSRRRKISDADKESTELNFGRYFENLLADASLETVQRRIAEGDMVFTTIDGVLDNEIRLEIAIGSLMFEAQPSLICFFTDTSIRDRIAQIEDNSNYKSHLFNSLSHELRTPMNGSAILLHELYKDKSLTEDIKENHVKPILLNMNRLSVMIHSMGDYSYISQNLPIKLNLKSFKIRSFLKKIFKATEFEAHQKNLDLVCHVEDDVPLNVFTDKERLGRVLLSLLENAVKFTFHGHVKLYVRLMKQKDISQRVLIEKTKLAVPTLQHCEDPAVILFTVEDTGIGMSREQLDRLKGNLQGNFIKKVSHNSTGASLGLTLSHELAKALGGGLEYSSELNKGTKVSFIVKHDEMSSASRISSGFRRRDLFSSSSLEVRQSGCVSLDKSEILQTNPVDRYDFNLEKIKFNKYALQSGGGTTNTSQNLHVNLNNNTGHNILEVNHQWGETTTFDPTSPRICECPEILVVDDDAFNVDSMKRMLMKLNARVAVAFHGKAAVESVESLDMYHKLNCHGKIGGLKLIIMDVNMPIMDGCQATTIIKEKIRNREISAVQIIGCTAYDTPEVHEACIQAQMDGVELKPMKPDRLKKLWNAAQMS